MSDQSSPLLSRRDPAPASTPEEIPLLAVRDTVVFPFMIVPLLVGRERSVAALDQALAKDRVVFLATQDKVETEDPEPGDLRRTGTMAAIVRMLKMPDGKVKILVQGLARARIAEFIRTEPCFMVKAASIADQVPDPLPDELVAMMRSLRALLAEAVELGKSVSPDALSVAEVLNEPGRLADLAASHLGLELAEAQKVLEMEDPAQRLRHVHDILSREVKILGMQRRIQDQTKEELSKNQRDYFLRQQLKTIQQELGEKDDRAGEMAEIAARIGEARMPSEVEKEARKNLSRLEKMHPDSAEAAIIRTYLEWMTEVPWTRRTRDRLDIRAAARVLDEDHYDLEKVKERILEFLGVLALRKKLRGSILCFAGPPGVGKTSLGRSVARTMGRSFVRMSLGGVRDEAEIRGHRRTYIGALPGRIIQGMKQAGSRNPVFMLDELDKLGADFRGDPSSALLEVLDPEQNVSFRDHYLGVPYDLSEVMFIATANLTDPIPAPLLDRMEVLRLSGYTAEEKKHIARRYLIPRQMERNGVTKAMASFSAGVIDRLIADYTREAGVRNLEREIGSLCRKVARRVAEGGKGRALVTAGMLPRMLGAPRFRGSEAREPQAGVVNGLAWTPTGGEVLTIEVSVVKGKGSLILTGSLGEVMKESAQASLSWVRSRGARLGVAPSAITASDIHVHVPAGAIPKDGPSAGIAITTALASALRGIPSRAHLAMTGEVTLTGRVLAVGGLKEKLLAARRAALTRVVVPEQNRPDIADLPAYVRKGLTIITVSTMDEALAAAFPPSSRFRGTSADRSARHPSRISGARAGRRSSRSSRMGVVGKGKKKG
jgi:ATP-dependent Lon protease